MEGGIRKLWLSRGAHRIQRRPEDVRGPAEALRYSPTTFYFAHLAATGLRFVNADVLAREMKLGAYEAAALADALRRELLRRRVLFLRRSSRTRMERRCSGCARPSRRGSP